MDLQPSLRKSPGYTHNPLPAAGLEQRGQWGGRVVSYVKGRAEVTLPLREGEAPPFPASPQLPSEETQLT